MISDVDRDGCAQGDGAAAALAETGLLDGEQRESLRSVAELAAWICGTPMAAVSLVENHRQFFAGSVGLAVRETDRDSSFCAVAMQTPDQPMLVRDALADPRFATNALVTGAPGIRSYAGVPLVVAEGVALGAVCALGTTTMDLSGAQVSALRALAAVTVELLEARRTATRLGLALAEVEAARTAEQLSREQFRSVFEHAPVGMTLLDADGRYLQVNVAFADLLGYQPGELVGRGSWEVTVAEDAVEDQAVAAAMLTGERDVSLHEKRYLRVDGTIIPALVTSSLIRGADGGRPLLLSQVESIEHRRAAETGLLEVQSAFDGIVSIDKQGRVTAWNLGAERLLGHPAAAMLGRTLERIIPMSLRDAHIGGIERVGGGGTPRLIGGTVEVPAIRADGRQILVELALSSWSQQGRVGYTGVLRDVTARRRSELLTDLIRHAASAANQAQTFAEVATEVLLEVCERLGWVAAHGWTAEDSSATWTVADHAHDATTDDGCPLLSLARAGGAPTRDQMPLDAETRYAASPAELANSDIESSLLGCRIGSGLAVPVLDGGETVGMLAFYLPLGSDAPDAELTGALQQIGTLLGRVIERERTAAQLRHQADHDPLTGLVNRRVLLEQIDTARAEQPTGRHRPAAAETGAAVMLFDLDRFRAVNNSLGHATGDRVLREAADRLRAAAGEFDVVARLGGDEFVVLAQNLPAPAGTADNPAANVAQQLLQALTGPVEVDGHQVLLRATAGVCTISPDHSGDAHSPEAVLRDADDALRHAKRRGNGGVEVFDAAMRTDAEQRLADEAALADAITNDDLVLHYQPIIDLQTETPVGVEALVRWSRPGHGLVRPDLFIPLAETSGLIVELGRWVLRRACADAARWPHELPALEHASVSVNVSARQLNHPQLLDDVDQALADAGLPAGRLIVEITESALIEDQAAALDVLAALRERGIRLALDDFGTGYASLGYVNALPIDILKIDKSFVDPITGPGAGTALTEVVLKLAEANGLRTIAEGVETPQQAAALRQLGCHSGQGYTWFRPLPINELAAALRTTLTTPGTAPSPAPRPHSRSRPSLPPPVNPPSRTHITRTKAHAADDPSLSTS